ncbi:hypothetical protein PTT_15900 [Pyrenophora teres f. teres 0-1]|uniref:Uncharacterized protein n=1 Tax=Pyrenophora teres f. teres (strain 0-1) TaxID=861557 RepID=E3S155_PYRTT|nr:hypothetical protein PTT_15900 [Pyrenophora teres f. teres 0-1]
MQRLLLIDRDERSENNGKTDTVVLGMREAKNQATARRLIAHDFEIAENDLEPPSPEENKPSAENRKMDYEFAAAVSEKIQVQIRPHLNVQVVKSNTRVIKPTGHIQPLRKGDGKNVGCIV